MSTLPTKYWFQLEFHSVNKTGTDFHGCIIHFVPTQDANQKDERALIEIVKKMGKHQGIRDIRSIDIEVGAINIISNLRIDWDNLLRDVLKILEEFLPSSEGFKKVCSEIAHGQGEISKLISIPRQAYLMALSLAQGGKIENPYN